jgi:hypothetical protein
MYAVTLQVAPQQPLHALQPVTHIISINLRSSWCCLPAGV